jgi:hypothetical protein
MSTAGGLPLGLAIVWLCTMSHVSRAAGDAATAGASWSPVSLWSRAVPHGPTAAAAQNVRKDDRVEPTESLLSHSNDSRGRRCACALSGVAYARARLPCMRGCMCMRACLRVYVSTRVCAPICLRASMFLHGGMSACTMHGCSRAPMCMLAREHTGGGQRVLALPSPHARIRRSSDAVAPKRFWCDATSSATTAGHPHLPATRPRRLQLLLSGEMVSRRRSSARRHTHAACVARRCAARADRLEWAGWARGSAV